MQFLPLEGTIAPNHFMYPAAEAIMQRLVSGSIKCLASESQAWHGPQTLLLPPSQSSALYGASGPVLDNAMCSQASGKEYVHASMRGASGSYAEQVLQRLGVGTFGPAQLVACLESPHAHGLLGKKPAAWFAELLAALGRVHAGYGQVMPEDGWQRLARSAPIFRLASGQVVSKGSTDRVIHVWNTRSFTLAEMSLMNNLSCLDPGSVILDQSCESMLACRFGIRLTTAVTLVDAAVLYSKSLVSAGGGNHTHDKLLQLVHLVARHIVRAAEEDADVTERVRTGLKLRTQGGANYTTAAAQPLFLLPDAATEGQDTVVMAQVLQAAGVMFLHESYLSPGGCGLGDAAPVFRSLAESVLGVKPTTPSTIIRQLLGLHERGPSFSPAQLLQQFKYLAEHGSVLSQDRDLGARAASAFLLLTQGIEGGGAGGRGGVGGIGKQAAAAATTAAARGAGRHPGGKGAFFMPTHAPDCLAKALGKASFSFISGLYLDPAQAGIPTEQAKTFLQSMLGVQPLDEAASIEAVIKLHSDRATLKQHFDADEIIQHARFVWQQCKEAERRAGGGGEQLEGASASAVAARLAGLKTQARKHFCMITSPFSVANISGNGQVSSTKAPAEELYRSPADTYVSRKREGWQLSEVLFLGEVSSGCEPGRQPEIPIISGLQACL